MHRVHKRCTHYHDSQQIVKKETQEFLQNAKNIHTIHSTFQLKLTLEAVKHQQFFFIFTRFTGADN